MHILGLMWQGVVGAFSIFGPFFKVVLLLMFAGFVGLKLWLRTGKVSKVR